MNTEIDKYEYIANHRTECKKFVEKGGSEALYWAGRMSEWARKVTMCSPRELSFNIDMMDRFRVEYDDVIFRMVK